MDWMFHTRTIHTSYMTASLPTPDFIIFYICTRNKNKKRSRGCLIQHFVFCCYFVCFLLAGIWVLQLRPTRFGTIAPSKCPWSGQLQGRPSGEWQARLLRSLEHSWVPGHGWALMVPRLQLQLFPTDQKGNPQKWRSQQSQGYEEGHAQPKPHVQAPLSPFWALNFRNDEGLIM